MFSAAVGESAARTLICIRRDVVAAGEYRQVDRPWERTNAVREDWEVRVVHLSSGKALGAMTFRGPAPATRTSSPQNWGDPAEDFARWLDEVQIDATMLGPAGPTFLTGVAFSPDGRVLASIESGGVALWNPATRQRLRFMKGDGAGRPLAFSPDGNTLAVGGPRFPVRLLDLRPLRPH